jgi:hypothetical protein
MSVQAKRALMQRVIEEGWNARNLAAFDRVIGGRADPLGSDLGSRRTLALDDAPLGEGRPLLRRRRLPSLP